MSEPYNLFERVKGIQDPRENARRVANLAVLREKYLPIAEKQLEQTREAMRYAKLKHYKLNSSHGGGATTITLKNGQSFTLQGDSVSIMTTAGDGFASIVMEYEPGQSAVIFDKTEKTTEEEGSDYLWIGIRPTNKGIDLTNENWSLCGMLIEPDGTTTLLGEAGMNYQRGLFMESDGPISSPDSFRFGDMSAYRAQDMENPASSPLHEVNTSIVQPESKEPLGVAYKAADIFNPNRYGTSVLGGVHFSANGVIGHSLIANAHAFGSEDTITPQSSLMPVDPKAAMTGEAYPTGQYRSPPSPFQQYGDPHWHNTFVLDPLPAIKDPAHLPKREQDTQIEAVVKQTIKTLYGKAPNVQPGAYMLKVLAFGICRPNFGTGIDIEVEVRLGKPQVVSKTFTGRIEWWSTMPRAVFPFGSRQSSIFAYPEFGAPNPHGPMWWQDAVEIDVKGLSATLKEGYAPAPHFGSGTWDGQIDVCTALTWSPRMLSSFYPGTVPIGDTLEVQSYHFARTWYYSVWYAGDQGWGDPSLFDWSIYNLAPIISAILSYASGIGRTSLDGTKIIVSTNPADEGTRPDPVITILEMSTTSSTEWTDLVNGGQIYNGEWHHMRAVF